MSGVEEMVAEGGTLVKLKKSIDHEHPLTKMGGCVWMKSCNQCDLYIFWRTNFACHTCKFFIRDCCLKHVNESVTVAAKGSVNQLQLQAQSIANQLEKSSFS